MTRGERDAHIGALSLTWAARRMAESAYVSLKSYVSGEGDGDDALGKMLKGAVDTLMDVEMVLNEMLNIDEDGDDQ